MVVTCEEVWREISNYLDGELSSDLRSAMEGHLQGCERCRAVRDGTRNVIGLYGEEHMFEPPVGYSQRLHQRLEENMPRKRGTAFGWMVALAAAVLLVVGFEIGDTSTFFRHQLRSEHAQPGSRIPADLMVVVSEEGKTFHVPGCTFLHDKVKLRTLTAAQALREGYSPCVRCMKKYLTAAAGPLKHRDEEQEFASAGDTVTR